jgi:hypothetical protein
VAGLGSGHDARLPTNLVRSFERHLRAENRSEHTIASYLESIRQAEAFLAGRGLGLLDARTWQGDRLLEWALKRRRMAPRYCPICRQAKRRDR